MTVINGKIWPDHEFPQETFAYHADRDSVHDFGTALCTERDTLKTIERLKTDEQTFRLRVARYELVEVIEIDCIGERPRLPTREGR